MLRIASPTNEESTGAVSTVICNTPLTEICEVGDPFALECKGRKYHSVFRGQRENVFAFSHMLSGAGQPVSEIVDPGYLLLDIPVVDGKPVTLEFNTSFTFRFLARGTMYGFKSFLLRVHSRPLLAVFEYPLKVEKFQLRKKERVDMIIPAVLSTIEGVMNGECAILDLSPHGAGVMLKSGIEIPVGEIMRLSFTLPDGVEVTDCLGEVRNSRAWKGYSQIGVRFGPDNGNSLAAVLHYWNGSQVSAGVDV